MKGVQSTFYRKDHRNSNQFTIRLQSYKIERIVVK